MKQGWNLVSPWNKNKSFTIYVLKISAHLAWSRLSILLIMFSFSLSHTRRLLTTVGVPSPNLSTILATMVSTCRKVLMVQCETGWADNLLLTLGKCLARKASLCFEEMRWDITLGRSDSTEHRVQENVSSEELSLTSTTYSRPTTATPLNSLTNSPSRLLGVGSSTRGPSVKKISNFARKLIINVTHQWSCIRSLCFCVSFPGYETEGFLFRSR